MLIYFDSKDLINIFQKSVICSASQFEKYLRTGNHTLVLSLWTITEFSARLHHKDHKENVMALLNRIDNIPRTYIRPAIQYLELKEAIQAFINNREYRDINPYQDRFDKIVDFNAQPATKLVLNYSLSKAVWDLYSVGQLRGLDDYTKEMRRLFASDRALHEKPSLKANFIKTIERYLLQYKLQTPSKNGEAFANWIYENPSHCPSVRFGYEVHHAMLKNIGDIPKDSDMEDFCHLECLPYVDRMTVDRRMKDYIRQVSKSIRIDYMKKNVKAEDYFSI